MLLKTLYPYMGGLFVLSAQSGAVHILDDGKVPILPYTRYNGKQERYKPWEYRYDPADDTYICPQGEKLRHTTTDRDGKRTYRSTPERCRNCPCKAKCGANEKGQKQYTPQRSGRSHEMGQT